MLYFVVIEKGGVARAKGVARQQRGTFAWEQRRMQRSFSAWYLHMIWEDLVQWC